MLWITSMNKKFDVKECRLVLPAIDAFNHSTFAESWHIREPASIEAFAIEATSSFPQRNLRRSFVHTRALFPKRKTTI